MSGDDHGLGSVRISFDYSRAQLSERLVGLSDEEYLWEPVAGSLSVRPDADGTWRADPDDPTADPSPFSTIAWRLWHLVDCFDSYRVRAYESGDDEMDHRFEATATAAIARLDQAVAGFLAGLDALGPAVTEPLGPDFGPFAERNHVDLALHALRELVHHGAEIAQLRDLWASGLR